MSALRDFGREALERAELLDRENPTSDVETILKLIMASIFTTVAGLADALDEDLKAMEKRRTTWEV